MPEHVENDLACAVCGSPSILPTGTTADHGGRSYALGGCSSCGSIATMPIPGKDVLDRFYANDFSYAWYSLHADGKRRDAAERADELAPLLGARVLDLGGGLGYLSEVLRGRGHDAVVYDPYADDGIARPAEGSFDAVVSLHVLEHTPDPLAFLRESARFLRPGGRFVLSVPNAAGIGYRTLGMSWVWAQPPVLHIHHFTSSGLVSLFGRAGFDDVRVSFHERWDANARSDLGASPWPRILSAMGRIPHVRRYGAWRRLVAALDIRRRFRELGEARLSPHAEADRAEIMVSGIWNPGASGDLAVERASPSPVVGIAAP